MNQQILIDSGIDYQGGLKRLLNDSALYERVLKIFLRDTTFEQANEALICKDYPALFACMHDLKGSSGNMSMTALYAASSALCDELRTEAYNPGRIRALYEVTKNAYDEAKLAIERALEG